MAFRFHASVSQSAFARYRAGLAFDRLSAATTDVERRAAVSWALAWMRLAKRN